MHVITTELPGVMIIEPRVFQDSRGFFKETYQQQRYAEIGIDQPFVQDNASRSSKGVLRGLHLQKKQPQGKLVSCSQGRVFDVVVDVDPQSATFGDYVSVELSAENHRQLWVPPGYAHGFCTLSEVAEINYKCTALYAPDDEGGLIWNDPDVAIDWPIDTPLLSDKDQQLPSLAQLQL